MIIPPLDRRGLQEIIAHSIWTVGITVVVVVTFVVTRAVNLPLLGLYGIVTNTLISRSTRSAGDRTKDDGGRVNLLTLVGLTVSFLSAIAVAITALKTTGGLDALMISIAGTVFSNAVTQTSKGTIDRSSAPEPPPLPPPPDFGP